MDVIRGSDRGHAQHGWLDSHHTFSFADYYDPSRMGFGVLRVINDDRVAPGAGFPTHPHRDMEIISYVVEGGLEHRDTLGHGGVIRPGDVQRMSAGRGVAHSEFNASQDVVVRFLQIWIHPAERGRAPGYEQKTFAEPEGGALQLLVSPDGADGSVRIGQDARILRFKPTGEARAQYRFAPGRSGWLQVVNGAPVLARTDETDAQLALGEGDGVPLPEGGQITLTTQAGAEALLFDLPKVSTAEK